MSRQTPRVLLFVLLASILLAGMAACAPSAATPTNAPAATNAPASNVPAATDAPNATDTPAATDAPAERTVISAFIQEAGQSFPDELDRGNNWLTDAIKELANIEFSSLEVPAYADTETKFNLMMASGSIPDFVHRAQIANMTRFGDEGAFADITGIRDNSAILQAKYNDTMWNFMKRPNGVINVLHTLPINDDYDGIFLRADLLDKAGWTGEFPETLDEIVEAMRAIKAWDPTALPYVLRGTDWYHSSLLTRPFNTSHAGFAWYNERDKYCNHWEGDNIVKAAEFARNLYAEGLLDPEFITTNRDEANQKRVGRNCFVWNQNAGGMSICLGWLATDGQSEARLIPVAMPMAADVGVDAYRTAPALLGSHAIAFSARASEEALAACVRLLDVLLSDEVYDLTVYGREGVEYTLNADGTKTPIMPAAAETAWRNWMGFAYTYNTADAMALGNWTSIRANADLSDAEVDEYSNTFNDASADIRENYINTLPYSPLSFVKTIVPDEINNMVTECAAAQLSLFSQVIMDEITVAEFAVQKEALVQKYQAVTDYYNAEIDKVRGTY